MQVSNEDTEHWARAGEPPETDHYNSDIITMYNTYDQQCYASVKQYSIIHYIHVWG